MNKKEIYFDYLNKINTLKKHNKAYYEYSSPNVTDEEYDNLKKKIL